MAKKRSLDKTKAATSMKEEESQSAVKGEEKNGLEKTSEDQQLAKNEEEHGSVEAEAEVPSSPPIKCNVADILMRIRKQARDAIEILLKVSERAKGKSLFPEVDQMIQVLSVYKKPAMRNAKALHRRIILPHSYMNEKTTTVCLIMPDMDRSAKAMMDPDVDKQARFWMDALQNDYGVRKGDVHKVITVRQMEREYRTYFEKRQLASAYDIFLADSSVARIAASHCGKEFHRARKMPLSVDIEKKSLVDEIRKARHTVVLPLSANRTRTSLSIGHLGQPISDLLDNVQEAVARLFEFCPGGILNIRTLYLSGTTGGPSLPIYADLGSANDVQLPKASNVRKRKYVGEVEDELSTLPEGLSVKVRKDGSVRVVDSTTKKAILYPTVHDEWEPLDDLKPRIDPEKMALAKERKKKARLLQKQRDSKKRKLKLKKEAEKEEGATVKRMFMETETVSKAVRRKLAFEEKQKAKKKLKRQKRRKRLADEAAATVASAENSVPDEKKTKKVKKSSKKKNEIVA